MIIYVVMQNDSLVRAFSVRIDAERYVDSQRARYIRGSEYSRGVYYWIASVELDGDDDKPKNSK